MASPLPACKGLDERAEAFRSRPLDGAYPRLWLDARIERVRDRDVHTVRHKALLVAYGVHESGRREVIGIAVGQVESEATWRDFLRGLVARGLAGVQPVVSDAHPGLKNAIAQVIGAQWQRCAVHFVRDVLGHVPRPSHPLVRGALKQVVAALDRDMAAQVAAGVIEQLQGVAPEVARLLEEAEEDLLAYMRFPRDHWSKIRSTNPLERVNREIARRSDVSASTPRRRRPAAPCRRRAGRDQRRVAGDAPLHQPGPRWPCWPQTITGPPGPPAPTLQLWRERWPAPGSPPHDGT